MSIMNRIRCDVFGMSQVSFAAAVGVTQATVSRWEWGMEPTRDHLAKIRQAAMARGLLWNDAWFFDALPDPAALPSREVA